jgi:hypothetical protein
MSGAGGSSETPPARADGDAAATNKDDDNSAALHPAQRAAATHGTVDGARCACAALRVVCVPSSWRRTHTYEAVTHSHCYLTSLRPPPPRAATAGCCRGRAALVRRGDARPDLSGGAARSGCGRAHAGAAAEKTNRALSRTAGEGCAAAAACGPRTVSSPPAAATQLRRLRWQQRRQLLPAATSAPQPSPLQRQTDASAAAAASAASAPPGGAQAVTLPRTAAAPRRRCRQPRAQAVATAAGAARWGQAPRATATYCHRSSSFLPPPARCGKCRSALRWRQARTAREKPVAAAIKRHACALPREVKWRCAGAQAAAATERTHTRCRCVCT